MVKTSLDIDLNSTPTDHDTPANVGLETFAELNKMRLENNKLREMLTLVREGNFIKNHVNEPIQDPKCLRSNDLNKRKLKERDYERNTGETTEPITRVCRRLDSSANTMVVKDGYKWRKYGQKVSKGNPSPRAYYKCTFPSCPAKKKVQGSVNNTSLQVVVYEGEHIHQNVGILGNEEGNLNSKLDQVLVETVANSLRRNPDFIQELVEAISSKNMEYDLPGTLR